MSVNVKGLNEAIKALRQKGVKAERAIVGVLEDVASNIEQDAKNAAPIELFPGGIDVRTLKGLIDKVVSNKGLNWEIGVQANMDLIENHVYAYAEFGTGLDAGQILSQAEYTDEIRSLARTFKKNGKGTLKGKPYLFPAYIRRTANLVDEMKKEVADALK